MLCDVLSLSSQMWLIQHPLIEGIFQLHGKTHHASESGGRLLQGVKETACGRRNTYFRLSVNCTAKS